MKINTIYKIAFCLLIVQNLFGQNPSEKFEIYQNSHHLEKVYIAHDKPFYLLGDTIWAQATFVDGRTHQFFNASPIVYVDWMTSDGELIDNYLLKIDQGLASFEIPTGYDDQAGEFILRAYTQYQRNFDQEYLFQKNIRIYSDSITAKAETIRSSEFSANFFPEGGELVVGLNSKVAVKVLNENAENVEYTGSLVDENDNEIKTFKSYNEGISFFEFIPQKGIDYEVQIDQNGIKKSFDLQKGLSSGYNINVNGRSKDHIIITLQSNTKELLEGAKLVGHVRGQIFIDQELSPGEKQQLKLPRAQMPSGILHFTLFDHKGRPVCERLTFNKNPEEQVDVEVNLEKSVFNKREKIQFDIATEKDASSVPSSFSVSVYNKDLIPSGNDESTIVNYFLLQSDLKGRVENVNQYFVEDNTKNNFLLDLLMLTHGWRRFTWQDILKEKLPEMAFATAEDIPIIGIVRKHKKDDAVKADVFLSILSKADFSSTNITTEDDGIFYFKGFEFGDTTDVLIQANIHNPKKKKKLKQGESKRTGNSNVDIEILELDQLPYEALATLKSELYDPKKANELAKEFGEIKRIDYMYHPEWSIDLDEVTIKGQRKTEKEKQLSDLEEKMKDRGMIYFPSSQKIFLDDLPMGGQIYQDIFQVIRGRAPGVQIKGLGPDRYALIRNTANFQDGDIPATIMVDGFQLSDAGATQINLQNILAIDIIKGLYATSVFGESGAGGVISIITRTPGDFANSGSSKKVKGSVNLRLPGFHNGREFYTPNYDKKSPSHQQPNLGTTLYWEPMIRVGKKSKKFSFFGGDRPGNYLIKVEGITDSGWPFTKLQELTIVED